MTQVYNKSNEPTFKLTQELEVTRLDHHIMGFHKEIASAEKDGVRYSLIASAGGFGLGVIINRKDGSHSRYSFSSRDIFEAVMTNADEWDKVEKRININQRPTPTVADVQAKPVKLPRG